MEEKINHPLYYNNGNIEVIDFIEDKDLNFNRGNVIKYICRAGNKPTSNELDDLKKARWYIEREISMLEEIDRICTQSESEEEDTQSNEPAEEIKKYFKQ